MSPGDFNPEIPHLLKRKAAAKERTTDGVDKIKRVDRQIWDEDCTYKVQ